MIEVLQKLMPDIHQAVKDSCEGDWDSLIINRRKPHTYRIFRKFGEYRVCLHRFEKCEEKDAFPHPHPWPGAFLLLDGEYIHSVGGSADLETAPQYYLREIVRPYSMYEIINPLTWHKVQPLTTTYTIMVNGEPWNLSHNETKTTKGKDLEKMSNKEISEELVKFNLMLKMFNRKFERK